MKVRLEAKSNDSRGLACSKYLMNEENSDEFRVETARLTLENRGATPALSRPMRRRYALCNFTKEQGMSVRIALVTNQMQL